METLPPTCDHVTLRCIGCDQVLVNNYRGQVMGISCACGADAPILYCCENAGAAIPSSLGIATGNRPPPHLEYYLGFSDHRSDLKTLTAQALRALGSISYTECADAKCNDGFARTLERRKYWEEQRKKYEGGQSG